MEVIHSARIEAAAAHGHSDPDVGPVDCRRELALAQPTVSPACRVAQVTEDAPRFAFYNVGVGSGSNKGDGCSVPGALSFGSVRLHDS